MTSQKPTHATTIALSESLPDTEPAGSLVNVMVQVACAGGCDLRGLPVSLFAPDGTASVHALATFDKRINVAGPIALHVPATTGSRVWRLSVTGNAHGSDVQHDAMLEISITVGAHPTSLAVWSIPDAAVAGERFTVIIGAKSSGGHDLGGQTIEVCETRGNVAGRAVLAGEPLQGTSALYWAEVALVAPGEPGVSRWSARFSADEAELPHAASAATFTVAVVPPPEHRLTVDVVDKTTSAPIGDAIVRAGAFRGATNAGGRAELKVADGVYEVVVWKTGFDAPPITIEIAADKQLRVEVAPVPEEDLDARWLG